MKRLLLPLLMATAACDSPTAPAASADRSAGAWRTWVVTPAELRVAAPPDPASTEARQELERIVALQRGTTFSAAELARFDGAPTTFWTDQAVQQLEFYWPLLPAVRLTTPVRAARILALLHVAIYDALVVSWDAKYRFARQAPFAIDRRVQRRVRDPGAPSYPSEHAAAATAAAIVLKYAFADAGVNWDSIARRAGESRIAAGVADRFDVEAGAEIGRSVGAAVLARAMADGSTASWDSFVPNGPDKWKPTPPRHIAEPFDPMAGKWRTWVIDGAAAFRPPPPPAINSAEFTADLNELRRLASERTAQQADLARYWATGPPPLRWTLLLEEEIERRALTPMRAARAHALLSTVMHDAMLACWDAKYYYWLARPVTVDSTLKPVVSTPPFPSYPSGHSTMSYAAYQVMSLLFPEKDKEFKRYAEDASISRVYGGIHYRFDIIVGDTLGARVGREAVRRARTDGAEARLSRAN